MERIIHADSRLLLLVSRRKVFNLFLWLAASHAACRMPRPVFCGFMDWRFFTISTILVPIAQMFSILRVRFVLPFPFVHCFFHSFSSSSYPVFSIFHLVFFSILFLSFYPAFHVGSPQWLSDYDIINFFFWIILPWCWVISILHNMQNESLLLNLFACFNWIIFMKRICNQHLSLNVFTHKP